MGFIKRGTGEVLGENSNAKTAANGQWTEADEQDLREENEQADKGEGER